MILIVDDHEDTGRLLCRAFCDRGYDAHHCSHARDALQVLQVFRPALLILDLLMPDINGLDLLQDIRRNPDLSDVPVLVHSATDIDNHRSEAEALGIDAFVPKRQDALEQLLSLAHKLLGPPTTPGDHAAALPYALAMPETFLI
jgi:chemosensory pili system protein ChpA (sensor histidine kinase/response regulator)